MPKRLQKNTSRLLRILGILPLRVYRKRLKRKYKKSGRMRKKLRFFHKIRRIKLIQITVGHWMINFIMAKSFFLGLCFCGGLFYWGLFGWGLFGWLNFFYHFFDFGLLLDGDVLAFLAHLNSFFLSLATLFGLFFLFNFKFFDHFLVAFEFRFSLLQLFNLTFFLDFFSLNTLVSD